MQFRAKVKEGKISVFRERLYANLLKSIEGKEVVVEFRVYDPQRSYNQLKYYWSILGFIAEQTYHTKDELHLIFKKKFLKKIVEVDGVNYEFIPSLSNIKKKELWEYTENIRYYMNQEVEMYIPEAEEMSMVGNSRLFRYEKIK